MVGKRRDGRVQEGSRLTRDMVMPVRPLVRPRRRKVRERFRAQMARRGIADRETGARPVDGRPGGEVDKGRK